MRLVAAVAGTAAGFFVAGPIGAAGGFVAGLVLGGLVGGRKATGASSIEGWNLIPAKTPPGDYAWFDKLAQKAKPAITFRATPSADVDYPMHGTVMRVYLEPDGKRVWVVKQTMFPVVATGHTPTPIGSMWQLRDADIWSGSNAGEATY